MGRIASFHLVRHAHALPATARLGTDRPRLARVPGLRFWRLLGTGHGQHTGPGADLRRTALFAVWDDPADLDAFLASSAVARHWAGATERYTVRLRGIHGHGRWKGVDVVDGLEPGPADGAVAVVTRAVVKARHWRTFARAGGPVSDELATAPGLLALCGIGEAPIGRQATFSLWRGTVDLEAFAYRMPHHVDVVRRTRAEGWYGEELFARFAPYGSEGTWDGRDPLG